MKIPQLVLLTNLKMPGQPPSPIAVRCDMVVLVERTAIRLEEQPVQGVKTSKVGAALPPGSPTEGTCLHLAGGGRAYVEESVEEATGALRKAARGGWFS